MKGNQKNKNYVIEWTPKFAYAIGLLVTDGSLSIDGRHIDFTSKDIQLARAFKECLNLDAKIGYKTSSFTGKKYSRIQFSNVALYKYLLTIGLTPNKSKTIGKLKVPSKYFFDFLRGHLDGDGCFYSYWDERWPNSFMFYTRFVSASLIHLKWLHKRIYQLVGVKGSIAKGKNIWQLGYAKNASRILWKKMYYKENIPCLLRKRKKIKNIFKIQAQVV